REHLLNNNYKECSDYLEIMYVLSAGKDKLFNIERGKKLDGLVLEIIADFESKKERLAELMDSDWKEAAMQLAAPKITQLTRQNIPEAAYDVAMYHDKNNKRLLADKYAWLSLLYPDGHLVNLGNFDANGVNGNRWKPDNREEETHCRDNLIMTFQNVNS
ncbi:MAG: hypothetical protein Q8R25_01065, partial [bacterium]|nr:hypothetical protein [bacterium]